MRVEVAGQHGSFERPVVQGQREIVLYQGNLIGVRSLHQQRRDPAALRTLQVFENDECDLRTFGRTESFGGILRENRQAERSQTDQNQSGQNSGEWRQFVNLHMFYLDAYRTANVPMVANSVHSRT